MPFGYLRTNLQKKIKWFLIVLYFYSLFLPAFLIAYYVSPRKIRNYTLLFFSLFFYAWGAPWFIFYLIGSTVLNHYFVVFMDRSENRNAKKLWLASSVFLTIGLLLYFSMPIFLWKMQTILEDF